MFSKLAAAAAERPPLTPPPPLLVCDSREDFGAGMEGEVVVLAMDDSVCTRELRSGVFGLDTPVGNDACKRGENWDEADKCILGCACDGAMLETTPPSCRDDIEPGAWFCESEVNRGLLVRFCARESSSCCAATLLVCCAGGETEVDGGDCVATVLRRLWARGEFSSCWLLGCFWPEEAAASIPN